jgi:hypothetical protein
VGGSRNHCSGDDVISHKVTKGLEPTRAVVGEGIPLEEGSVECVCIVNKLLKIFKMYCFSEILCSNAGMPGASKISKRLSINSERLENN